jgi:predicted HTH domain antitoxin
MRIKAGWQAPRARRQQMPYGGEWEMSLVIPDEILHTARMTAAELAQEIAILLYEKEKLTLGQASQLAQMSQLQFQFLLASRQISIHYGVAEFEADLQTLRDMGRL